MIGILCKTEEEAVVREFFELFKTPWEFYGEGRPYEVVIASVDGKLKPGAAKLAVLYGTEETDFDRAKSISSEYRRDEALIGLEESALPIYSGLLTFKGGYSPLLPVMGTEAWAALRTGEMGCTVVRVGFDLWREIVLLLSLGQSIDNALIPTLELHIALLRSWIVGAGIPVVEIPPIPAGHAFIACLTHDVDFWRIGNYGFDPTMLGFLYRASLGSLVAVIRGRLSMKKLLRNWRAVASLPFVCLGLCKDFWSNFQDYATLEDGSKSTFFIIPFKNRPGEKVSEEMRRLRASKYDIDDVRQTMKDLVGRGFEIGVHGIDAWHDAERGREEQDRIASLVNDSALGVRIHWLCSCDDTFRILEEAGFSYDSSFGYNYTVGYKGGTTQAFRPLGTDRLVELPLHLQDTALFSFRRLNLSEEQAWGLCAGLLEDARSFGGVLTVVWHDRSLCPERLWGDFYARLLKALKESGAWFAPAGQVVTWFKKRRAVSFTRVERVGNNLSIGLKMAGPADWQSDGPNLIVRLHIPQCKVLEDCASSASLAQYVDVEWNGESTLAIPMSSKVWSSLGQVRNNG